MFIAIIELLKPLTFNYYLHLMRTSIAISGGEIVGYIIIITLPVFSFASLMYLMVGHTDSHFKDLQSSFMTFWILLLSISFKNTVETDDLQVKVIFTIFTLTMSIILVNVFVSLLTDSFASVKKLNGSSNKQYDKELNEHFWRKISEYIRIIANKRRFGK